MIVAEAPGSTQDIVARLMAPEMSKVLGTPIVVENKPGASSIIAFEYVANQSPPDGYTILVATVQTLAITASTVKNLRFDPLKELPPFIGLSEGRFVLGSSSTMPWKTFDEMITYSRANPGKLNYGAVNPLGQIYVELPLQSRGLTALHVPYSNGGNFIQAMLSGEVHVSVIPEALALSFGDKYRVLVITGEARSPNYPGVPTFGEIGHPQLRGFTFSLNARTGTPRAVIDKLNAAASQTLRQPEIKANFTKRQWDIVEQTPEVAAKALVEQATFLSEIAKKAGIEPQ